MKFKQFVATFEKFDDEYIEFQRIENKLSNRRDLHAFILLDKLIPMKLQAFGKIISSAEHDEIWLAVEVEELAIVITEEQILELVRCGVRYDEDNEALSMFA